jgi:MFS family permease
MKNYTFNITEEAPSTGHNTSPISSISYLKPDPSIFETEISSTTPTPPPRPRKSIQFKLTVFFLCLISVIAAMDAVIVGACLSAISSSLECTSVQAFWIGTSFLLAQTVTIPIYGTTSEIFGRKWAIITGITLFFIGSVLCATAQSIEWLISARVVQGIGAGGITQLVQVILSDITTMEERALYISMSMASWAFGTNIGVSLPILHCLSHANIHRSQSVVL